MRPRGMLMRWWDRWRSRLVVPNTVPPPPIVHTRGHLERTVPPRIDRPLPTRPDPFIPERRPRSTGNSGPR